MSQKFCSFLKIINIHVLLQLSGINFHLTLQDLNIGIALWLAASGDGWVYEERDNENDEDLQLYNCKSDARIVLVGSGADEQCAGYGRHKTKYKHGRYCLNKSFLRQVTRAFPIGLSSAFS